jgi:hypothetical protein
MPTDADVELAHVDDRPRTPARRIPVWLPRLLAESALIVFSVLLALAVDEWRDGRSRAAAARVALDAIVSELDSNRRSADQAMRFHRTMKATLDGFAARRELPPHEVAYSGMIQPARVVATAWTSARDTGAINELPYSLVLQLSRVYERQASYDALTEQIAADIYIDGRRRGMEAVLREGFAGFIGLTHDFANREEMLIRQYDQALAALGRTADRGDASSPQE